MLRRLSIRELREKEKGIPSSMNSMTLAWRVKATGSKTLGCFSELLDYDR